MPPRRSFLVGVSLALPLFATAQTMRSVFVDATLDPATGTYTIRDRASGWRLAGTTGAPLARLKTSAGKDAAGLFHETTFEWTDEVPLRGTVRVYDENSAVFFRLTYPEGKPGKAIAFPVFTTLPAGLKGFSYEDRAFAPATFGLAQTSTPWLLFDKRARALVFSPASRFLVAKLAGDGETSMAATLDDRLVGVPKGLVQDSLLVFGSGIGRVWSDWGRALGGLYKRSSNAQDDPIVQKYGYWTDDGADYAYDYDPAKGYAGTLLALRDHYREAGLPLGYLQLGGWWYRKLSDDIAGGPGPERKNPKLAAGDWNRYGGTLEYRASPELFPEGLTAFGKALGLPLLAYGGWIDRKSPLGERFQISGVAPVDRRYWSDVASYREAAGATGYGQDWLSGIVENSPEMATKAGVADAFADGMANAMRAKGLTMQYGMAPPRFVLQGVTYPNLTAVRTSPERFEPKAWAPFLFGAPLVSAVGAAPWSGVFRSGETGDAIVATLSTGPVGNGDAIGKEDRANVLRVARPDGTIVKPDEPLAPTDATYLTEGEEVGVPFVASTLTDHGGLRTRYLFAFPRQEDVRSTSLSLRSLGANGRSYLADLVTGQGRFVPPDETIDLTIGDAGFVSAMAAPETRTGVALLGDWGKFVPTGKARLVSVDDRADGLRVRVGFAKGEGPVTLEGACERPPRVRTTRGTARLLRYDAATNRFAIEVAASGESAELTIDGRVSGVGTDPAVPGRPRS